MSRSAAIPALVRFRTLPAQPVFAFRPEPGPLGAASRNSVEAPGRRATPGNTDSSSEPLRWDAGEKTPPGPVSGVSTRGFYPRLAARGNLACYQRPWGSSSDEDCVGAPGGRRAISPRDLQCRREYFVFSVSGNWVYADRALEPSKSLKIMTTVHDGRDGQYETHKYTFLLMRVSRVNIRRGKTANA